MTTYRIRFIGTSWWVLSDSGLAVQGPFPTRYAAERVAANLREFGDERGER